MKARRATTTTAIDGVTTAPAMRSIGKRWRKTQSQSLWAALETATTTRPQSYVLSSRSCRKQPESKLDHKDDISSLQRRSGGHHRHSSDAFPISTTSLQKAQSENVRMWYVNPNS